MGKESIALVLLALDRHRHEIFHMTLVSHQPYEEAMQEVIGMGRVMLKNEREIVRVEIHEDGATRPSPLAVLTRDDIAFEERPPEKGAGGLAAFLRRLFHP